MGYGKGVGRLSVPAGACNFPLGTRNGAEGRGFSTQVNVQPTLQWRKIMPPRNPELPEGTDQIVNGTTAEEGGGKNVGFVASGGNGPARAATDKLVSQVRDQVETLRGQAGDKLRTYADDGKGRATGLLDNF